MLNSKNINDLRPDVAANCRIFLDLCKRSGYPVLITGTVRDDEFQMQCYKKGTGGKPPATFHSVKAGLAFDICKNVKGQEFSDPTFWQGIGAIGKRMGFTWGGGWDRVDKPHFQWDNHGKANHKNAPAMPLYKIENKEIEDDMTQEEVRAIAREEAKAQNTIYRNLEDIPAWGKPTAQKLIARGAISGTGTAIDLSYEQLRMMVINDRMGLYGGAL